MKWLNVGLNERFNSFPAVICSPYYRLKHATYMQLMFQLASFFINVTNVFFERLLQL